MRRSILLISAIASLLVLLSSPALARGGGWQPAPAEPFDATLCGGTAFHFDFPVNREYSRIVHLGGQDVLQVTGSFVVTITNTDTGQSITKNISGPGFTPLSEVAFSARGSNLIFLDPNQAASAGLPEMFTNQGYVHIVFNDDDTITVIKLTGHLTDLCAVLT
jgi:hypothetical protein